MSMNLKSSSWYRVAPLTLSMRPHAKIQRHSFRGQRWYVIQDQASGKHHRFTPAAYLIISLMDGERIVEEIWDIASEQLGDDGLTQDEVIQLLTQLHQSDILQGNSSPDFHEMSKRSDKQARRKVLQSIMNPMAVRLPLLDPDRFLNATLPLVRKLFSPFGALFFLFVVGSALFLAAMHWSALTANIADRVLATESILLLIVTYPFIKALHELGHGYAAKIRGAEVHEIGLMFLVFIPVPYVEASSVASFTNKWHRALVGAAGMLVEVFLAAIALFVWLNVEPGLVKAFAFNIMVIGGISTVLFNGNPLLRFDGYYVLSDLIEIPNLGMRSNRYIGYLIQRYLFGVSEAVSPVTAAGEARWFAFYGPAAFFYRIFISTTIILFVASEFFIVGVILGLWAAMMMFVWPLTKQIRFLFASPVLRENRSRAFAVSGAFVTAMAMILTLIPVPFATVSEGVVWADKETVVNAGTDGVINAVLVEPSSRVVKGQPLLVMDDPLLPAHVRLVEAELKELRLRYEALLIIDRAEARVVGEQIRHAQAELALRLQREKEMVVRSPANGRFLLLAPPRDLVGTFLRKGDSVGFVAELGDPTVRVVVPQSAIGLVRDDTREIRIRFANRFDEVRSARVIRELPFVTDRLPSLAFASQGGGEISIDPGDPSGAKALEMFFQLDLKTDTPVEAAGIGVRVFVRFGHGAEPLFYQAYRRVRQLFLKRFSV
jgi:putative peptide zinc metalloprotease protein